MSLSTSSITIRVGNCPQNKFSLVTLPFPVGMVKLLISTCLRRYFAVACCKAFAWASCVAGFGFTLRTNKVASFKEDLYCARVAFPC